MKRVLSLLLAVVLPSGLTSNCLTFQLFFPLSYELSSIVASDFVSYATNSVEIWSAAETYIEGETWKFVVDNWLALDSERTALSQYAASVDMYFRTALMDCYGTQIDGNLYSPPLHLRGLHKILLNRGCSCFGELTSNLFLER